jgi:hypothetical protein
MKIEQAQFRAESTGPQNRILVTGGRMFGWKWVNNEKVINQDQVEFLNDYLDRLNLTCNITDLAHGAAEGADTWADKWARSRDVRVMRFPANWKKHGNAAGPLRNEWMFDTFKPDLVVAFPGGAGTKHMINYAMNKVDIHYANPE